VKLNFRKIFAYLFLGGLSVWDERFLKGWLLIFPSCGIWRRVVWYIGTNISDKHAASFSKIDRRQQIPVHVHLSTRRYGVLFHKKIILLNLTVCERRCDARITFISVLRPVLRIHINSCLCAVIVFHPRLHRGEQLSDDIRMTFHPHHSRGAVLMITYYIVKWV
jgi:hypothetical protein